MNYKSSNCKLDYNSFLEEWHSSAPCVLVHTSGSTGAPKPMMVEKRRMEVSARNTCRFLNLKEGDSALLCMSLDYIAGKMMVVRSIVWGLRLIVVEPSGHPLKGLKEIPTFAAMVPMQVYNSLQIPEEREILRQIPHIIIGGGAIDDALETELSTFPNTIWSSYGMTETLSHIALRRITQTFSEYYTPFPSVTISLNEEGCLVIDAPELCATTLVTNDIAEMAPDGRSFRIIGRKDNIICSGGIKIHIEEVERILKPHIPHPFLITRRPDPKFGEIVVMLAVSSTATHYDIPSSLPKYYRPRLIIPVDCLPLTATGKPARKEAERIAAGYEL